MRSRLGMFAYYQKRRVGGRTLTLPGGIGYQYTYLLTTRSWLAVCLSKHGVK